MRILVMADTIGALSSQEAGSVISSGWDGAQVTVLPVGASGHDFAHAYADQLGAELGQLVGGEYLVTTARTGTVAVAQVTGPAGGTGIPYAASSRPLGETMADLLRPGVLRPGPPERLVVDLSGLWVHDGGAGLLAGLGATADRPLDAGVTGLTGITSLDLGPALALLQHTDLVGVVPADQLSTPLLGLRGITSLRRDPDQPELMLSTDATLAAYAQLAGPELSARPGAGACGGLGLAILALGGRLSTGPALALEPVDLRGVELVVTGCSVFDFASRGGGVVAAAAEVAAEVIAPCVVEAGEVLIGSREMRTMGIEAVYAVHESSLDAPVGAVTDAELAACARRVARSWRW